jgi:DNA-binding ferritin-like protein
MPSRRPTARERAVADAVTPLIADALALQRQLAACGRRAPAARVGAAPLLGVFADQMRASADILAECVREVGGRPFTRGADGDADARVDAGAAPTPSAPSAPRRRPPPLGDAFRRLLADEDEVAGRLRRAIATCDAHTDDRTADRLEEVLDEVERQRTVLRGLVPPAPR